MPRNKQHIPRDNRVAALLSAATDVFLDHGYDRTTIAEISTAAGVARANLYWYFPSKDEIFAAVMNQLLDNEIARQSRRRSGMSARDQLTTGIRELYPYRSLHHDMHQRVEHSPAVKAAHDLVMNWIRDLVRAIVVESASTVDPDMVADVVLATFEGARTATETRPANVLIPFILDTMIGPVPSPTPHERPGP